MPRRAKVIPNCNIDRGNDYMSLSLKKHKRHYTLYENDLIKAGENASKLSQFVDNCYYYMLDMLRDEDEQDDWTFDYKEFAYVAEEIWKNFVKPNKKNK